MRRNVWLLPIFLGVLLGSVYFLPKSGKTASSAVIMDLPDGFSDDGWKFQKIPPSEKEIGALDKSTEFSKAICLRASSGQMTEGGSWEPDRIDVSVVLSGNDLNNSIHRPERCLPAQGHTILSSRDVSFESPDGREFLIKRLSSLQRLEKSSRFPDGAEIKCLTYYFFVGHDLVTNDHFARTLIDMRDRILYGRDQRWAYISVSKWYGKIPGLVRETSEEETDNSLRKFLSEFTQKQIHWEQIR